MKTCRTCQLSKGNKLFYPGKYQCKPCYIAEVMENRRLKAEKYRQYALEYSRLPKRREKMRVWRASPAGRQSERIAYRFRKMAA